MCPGYKAVKQVVVARCVLDIRPLNVLFLPDVSWI